MHPEQGVWVGGGEEPEQRPSSQPAPPRHRTPGPLTHHPGSPRGQPPALAGMAQGKKQDSEGSKDGGGVGEGKDRAGKDGAELQGCHS